MALSRPLGLVLGIQLSFVERHAAKIAGLELCRETVSGKLGKCASAVVALQKGIERLVDLLVQHVENHVATVSTVENPLPESIDATPLLVHHLVVLEQVLAGLEVPLF